MYCSNCGAQAAGKFCSQCGAKLGSAEGPPALEDWHDEVRYHVLLHFAEVRDLIAQHASRARNTLSGEKFLELCDKAFKPLVPFPVATAVSIVVPLYARMGIRTGKTRSAVLATPTGKALVAALCALAQHGWKLKQVHQGDDGCVLEATLPSDMWALEGDLVVTVRKQGAQTSIEAATNIPGQLYDWGKSIKCLNTLFEDIGALSKAA